MLTIQGQARRGYCDGVSRRDFLKIGGLALGVFTRDLRNFGRSIVTGVTYAHAVLCAKGLWFSFAGIFAHQIMIIEFGMLQKKRCYVAIVAAFIFYAFGGRTIPSIEISRQAG